MGEIVLYMHGCSSVEAQQLSKQLKNYAQRFDDLMKEEKELTSQHRQSVSYNGNTIQLQCQDQCSACVPVCVHTCVNKT